MIFVERLNEYSYEDAVDLGRLRPYLSKGADDNPVPESHLRHIISSHDTEQLAARLDGSRRIVGAATLTIVHGALMGTRGALEDFVTDPEAGIKGIGQAVWKEMGIWCIEHGVDLEFTSKETRVAAHRFYERQGAEKRPTTVFKKHFTYTDINT